MRPWRFERLRAQAITGFGSQAGNCPASSSWRAVDPTRTSAFDREGRSLTGVEPISGRQFRADFTKARVEPNQLSDD